MFVNVPHCPKGSAAVVLTSGWMPFPAPRNRARDLPPAAGTGCPPSASAQRVRHRSLSPGRVCPSLLGPPAQLSQREACRSPHSLLPATIHDDAAGAPSKPLSRRVPDPCSRSTLLPAEQAPPCHVTVTLCVSRVKSPARSSCDERSASSRRVNGRRSRGRGALSRPAKVRPSYPVSSGLAPSAPSSTPPPQSDLPKTHVLAERNPP